MNGCSTITYKQVQIFLLLLLLERFCFPDGSVINIVVIWRFKVSLSVHLNVCLGHKSCKNLSNDMKLVYIFPLNNLCSNTKNCVWMLDTFYRAISKSFLKLCSAITFEWELRFPVVVVVDEKVSFSWWFHYIVNSVTMWQFKVCLPVCQLNICLG